MFISNNERIQLRQDIETLSKIVSDLNSELVYLRAKIKVLEGKKKAPKKMTEAQRIKQREYAKRYQAKKKLEKQNGNSVSTTSV